VLELALHVVLEVAFVLGGVVGALLGVGDVMGLVGCVDCGGVAERS